MPAPPDPPPNPAVASPKYGESFQIAITGETHELPYMVKGATSRENARDAIYSTAPGTITGLAIGDFKPVLVLLSVSADEQPGLGGIWNGTAHYGPPGQQQHKNTGEWAFQFETAGGSQHITNSLKTISKSKCGTALAAPDYGGAINVNGEGDVGGCDIVSPVFRFTVTGYFDPTAVTAAFLGNLYKLAGSVNSGTTVVHVNGITLSFAAGELLYEGASGGMRGSSDWEITYKLAASPNVADVCANWSVTVKPSGAVAKKGWEYCWVAYQNTIDTTALVQVRQPQAVYVEQVYPTADFSVLLIPAS